MTADGVVQRVNVGRELPHRLAIVSKVRTGIGKRALANRGLGHEKTSATPGAFLLAYLCSGRARSLVAKVPAVHGRGAIGVSCPKGLGLHLSASWRSGALGER
jgi:hypothetical protein